MKTALIYDFSNPNFSCNINLGNVHTESPVEATHFLGTLDELFAWIDSSWPLFDFGSYSQAYEDLFEKYGYGSRTFVCVVHEAFR
jgi:hypothetical protein